MLLVPDGWKLTAEIGTTLSALDATEPRTVATIAADTRKAEASTRNRLRKLRSGHFVRQVAAAQGDHAGTYAVTDAGVDLARLFEASHAQAIPAGWGAGAVPLQLGLTELRERNQCTVQELASKARIPTAGLKELEADPSPHIVELRRIVATLQGELVPLARTALAGAIIPLALPPLHGELQRVAPERIAEHLGAAGVEVGVGGDTDSALWVARFALKRVRFRELMSLDQDEYGARITRIFRYGLRHSDIVMIETWPDPRVRWLDAYLAAVHAEPWWLVATPAVTGVLKLPLRSAGTPPWANPRPTR